MENVIIAESGINLHGSNLSDYLGAALGALVSQMPPRCLPDASQMPPRCLPDASQMPPTCLPDASQMIPPP